MHAKCSDRYPIVRQCTQDSFFFKPTRAVVHVVYKNISKTWENPIIVQIMYCTKLDHEFANYSKYKIKGGQKMHTF